MAKNDVDITQLESVIVTWVREVLPKIYPKRQSIGSY